MNNILIQLAEQAAEYAVLNPSEDVLQSETEDVKIEVPKAFIEKFSDLIIQECAEVARVNTRTDSKVYLMIQEHFGVKG